MAGEHTLTAIRDPLVGTTVNGYQVTARVGEGGMGLVYSAVANDIGKRVAIKVMRPEFATDPSFFTRLISEARAVNAIKHRGIVDIFGSGQLFDGRQCLLMEYLEGESLEAALHAARAQNRTLPLGEVLSICDEVLNALAAAHQATIVHRDLKPSNIFLCKQPNGERHVKLLDFGIAKVAAAAPMQASAIMGTPLYMAPEQASADTITPAIDVYAFGVILFELLTGRVPFEGDSVVRVMFHHVNTPPPSPSTYAPTIPAALDKLVLELLKKRPHERPALDDVRKRIQRVRVALSDPSAVITVDEPTENFPRDTVQTPPPAHVSQAIDPARTGVITQAPPSPSQFAPTIPPPAAHFAQPATGVDPGASTRIPKSNTPLIALAVIAASIAITVIALNFRAEPIPPLPRGEGRGEGAQPSPPQAASPQNATTPNGTAPNGTAPNGTAQDATPQNGTAQNNGTAVPNGTAPNGTAPNGTAQTGTAPNGTAPNGTAQNGTAQNGTAQNGTAQTGTAQNGTAPNGTAPNGTAPNGTAQNGTAQNGTAQNGTAQNGTAPNGTAPAVSPASPKSSAKKTALTTRLQRLERQVAAQKKAGEDVELSERQLQALRAELAKAATPEQQEAIEVALTRLEQELAP